MKTEFPLRHSKDSVDRKEQPVGEHGFHTDEMVEIGLSASISIFQG